MTQYLYKLGFTTQGWTGLVANPSNRLEAMKPVFEAVGQKLLNYWFAVDQGAIYTLAEGPEDANGGLAVLMAVFGAGTISSTEGTRLVSAADAVSAMQRAQKLGYRPAGGGTPAKQ